MKTCLALLLVIDCVVCAPCGFGDEETQFFLAVSRGDADKVTALLASHPSLVEESKRFDSSPLHFAAQDGHTNIVELLIARGASVNSKNRQGNTPIHEAVYFGHLEVVKILIAHGADINARDSSSQTPLLRAISQKQQQIAAFLIAKAADVNLASDDGMTPLHMAAWYKNKEIVQQLLNRGARVNARNKNDRTPLNYAEISKSEELISLIQQHRGRGVGKQQIHTAAESGDAAAVKAILKNDPASVSAVDEIDTAPLHLAAVGGHADVAQLLLSSGASVDARTKLQNTPLILAAEAGHLELIKLLLTAGSNVNAANDRGACALHQAAGFGHAQIVDFLLASGAKIDAPDLNGNTPLHYAAEDGNKDVVQILLTKKANLNARNKRAESPLGVALKENHETAAQLLRKHRASDSSPSAFLEAINANDVDKVRKLLRTEPALANARYEIAGTALHVAAEAGQFEIVSLLLADNAKINAPAGLMQRTPLHKAALKGHKSVVSMLLAKGADINAKDNLGWTPLHAAASEAHAEVVELLVTQGAEVNAESSAGKAFELAAAQGHKGVLEILARYHAVLGAGLSSNGQYGESAANLLRALEIYRTTQGYEAQQAVCYKLLGTTLAYMGGYEEAIALQEQALRMFQAQRVAHREQAECHANIGAVFALIGKWKEATAKQEHALRIFQALRGTEREQGVCYKNIGAFLGMAGELEEAVAKQEQALQIYKTLQESEREQADCYMNIGAALWRKGNYEEAMVNLQEALRIYGNLEGTKPQQRSCWLNMGEVFRLNGKFAEAIHAFHQAGPGPSVSHKLGLTYWNRYESGDEIKAIHALCVAVRSTEIQRTLVLALEHRMSIFSDLSEVFPDLVRVLTALARKKVPLHEPELLQWTHDAPAEAGLLAAAFDFADRGKGRSLEDALREKSVLKAARPDIKLLAEDRELSLRISKLSSLREPLPETDTERRKKMTEEVDELQHRRNMIEVELKKTALGDYVAPDFRKPMEMAKELEPDRAVLQYSIGEKEGWLLMLTREGVTAHKVAAETAALPELLPRQEATVAQLAEAWKKRPDKIGVDGLVRLARARAEDLSHPEALIPATARDDLVTRAEKSPCQATPRHNLVAATTEQAILERLGEVLLPDPALAEIRKKGIRRLLVIPDGSLHYVPFAMLRLKNEKGDGTHYLVEEFASSYVPAMTTLDTIRKQKKEREAKRKVGRRELLAFANPAYGSETVPTLPPTMVKDDMVTRLRSFRNDYYKNGGLCLMASLPETEQEAVRVASLFAPPKEYKLPLANDPEGKAVIFVGKAASEEQAKRILGVSLSSQVSTNSALSTQHSALTPQWRYLLFSTHGLADTHNGMLSCLALSSPVSDSEEDGFLQAQEVMNLELDADLVMLSACQTGLGRLRGGEGLVGLSAAFFYAGAESVCASLWQVPSGPTSQLVPEFFKQLKEGKVDKAEALRQAQLHVLRQGQGPDGKPADYSTPFCWSAFVLMGEYAGESEFVTR